jgi:THO complex subunit 2
MDVVTTIQNYIATWDKGGESEWCVSCHLMDTRNTQIFNVSRGVLISPHCNPRDPNCVDVLTIVYHTLLSSALNSWCPKHTITPSTFVAFVQSVLQGLPSSSTGTSSNASAFGELLVDMIWAVDSELEEILTDAKSAFATIGEQETSMAKDSKDSSEKASTGKMVKLKQNAEKDKEIIADIVRKFLVSTDFYLFCWRRLTAL